MRDLSTVTLACVDTREPELALQAIARCTAGLRFADVVLFTEAHRVPRPPAGVRVVDVQIGSTAAYSHFMLKGLVPHVRTEHVLVAQWDGFVLDPAAWDPAFLDFDYIGPVWPQFPRERSVGNGGFSLRSRRLMEAMLDPSYEATHPEDLCICHQHRERLERTHGLRFAPPEVAERFAYEHTTPRGPIFGVHGLFNFHHPAVMDPRALRGYLAALPDGLARGLDAHDLCASLIREGRLGSAQELLEKRKRLGMRDRRTWRLCLRWQWARWHLGARATEL